MLSKIAKDNIARKWQSWDFNPGFLNSEPKLDVFVSLVYKTDEVSTLDE